jgi:hypothetical protein
MTPITCGVLLLIFLFYWIFLLVSKHNQNNFLDLIFGLDHLVGNLFKLKISSSMQMESLFAYFKTKKTSIQMTETISNCHKRKVLRLRKQVSSYLEKPLIGLVKYARRARTTFTIVLLLERWKEGSHGLIRLQLFTGNSMAFQSLHFLCPRMQHM